ncbi:MAG: hypothetical protein Roseis2KO_07280 [Roseivirga sp.]
MKAVRQVLKQRSQFFEKGKNQHQSLSGVRVPQPRYTPDNVSQYNLANTDNPKKQALYNIKDQQLLHNKELAQTVNQELSGSGYAEERRMAEDYDVQEILDESIEEHNQTSQDKLYSNREINQYLHQHGIDPERSSKGVRPLDNEIQQDQEKDLLRDLDELDQSKDVEQSKVKSWEVNKDDLDIDYEL